MTNAVPITAAVAPLPFCWKVSLSDSFCTRFQVWPALTVPSTWRLPVVLTSLSSVKIVSWSRRVSEPSLNLISARPEASVWTVSPMPTFWFDLPLAKLLRALLQHRHAGRLDRERAGGLGGRAGRSRNQAQRRHQCTRGDHRRAAPTSPEGPHTPLLCRAVPRTPVHTRPLVPPAPLGHSRPLRRPSRPRSVVVGCCQRREPGESSALFPECRWRDRDHTRVRLASSPVARRARATIVSVGP